MLRFLTLLVLALMGIYIGENHQVLCALKKIGLTMAEGSYDDQYSGCSSEMENELMNTNTDGFETTYRSVWDNATNHWKNIKKSLHLPPGFKDEYGIAIAAYTHKCEDLFKVFNNAVRKGVKSSDYYKQSFRFKSFHFLLTKATQALRTSQSGCYKVYRGIHGVRFNVSDNPVRWGQFASSSLNETFAKGFGEDTFFTIETCHGADISGLSIKPKQKEVLIPPYETFTIVESNDKGQINLKSSSKKSYFNCQSKQARYNRDTSSKGQRNGYSGMDKQTLAALEQIDAHYMAVLCNGPSSLSPGVPTSFLLWGFLLFAGAFHSMGSL